MPRNGLACRVSDPTSARGSGASTPIRRRSHGPGARPSPRNEAVCAWKAGDEGDILADAEIIDKAKILMDEGDRHGFRGAEPTPIRDFALVRLIEAGEGLDQRRFAGSVFADESMDFAAPYRQIDMVKSQGAQKSFGEAAYRYGRSGGSTWPHYLIPAREPAARLERDDGRRVSSTLSFEVRRLRARPRVSMALCGVAPIFAGVLRSLPDILIMAGEVVAGHELVLVAALAVDIVLEIRKVGWTKWAGSWPAMARRRRPRLHSRTASSAPGRSPPRIRHCGSCRRPRAERRAPTSLILSVEAPAARNAAAALV